jgi:hypothetical protein
MDLKRTVLGIVIGLTFLSISCSTSKRTAISCTEFPVYKTNKTVINHPGNRNHVAFNNQKTTKINQAFSLSKNKHDKKTAVLKYPVSADEKGVSRIEKLPGINESGYSKGLIASTGNIIVPVTGTGWPSTLLIKKDLSEKISDPQTGACDTMVLKSGTVIACKINEIGLNEIRFRKCNYLDGPVITISKSDIAKINYANGTSEIIVSSNPELFNRPGETNLNKPQQSEGLGTAGFLASILGLFIASIPLGLLAIIFGAVSLGKIKKNPLRFRGKGLAIASIIIGLIDFIGMIIVLASV